MQQHGQRRPLARGGVLTVAVVSTALDSTAFFAGVMEENNQLLFAGVFRSQIAFAETDWLVSAAELPFTVSKMVTFKKNGTPFATALFPSGGTPPIVPIVVMSSELTTFRKDIDILTIYGPGTPDATGGDLRFSFLGTRS